MADVLGTSRAINVGETAQERSSNSDSGKSDALADVLVRLLANAGS
jgi:hypothetical protein